jgi:hypothetical protein
VRGIRRWWEREFLRRERTASLALATVFALWLYLYGGDATTDRLLSGERTALYGALAAILGALLGFIITAFSIIIGFSQDGRFDVVFRSRHAPDLWAIFTSAIRAHAVATIAALIALVTDTETHHRQWPIVFLVGALILALFRLARVVWVIERMVALLAPRTRES